MIVNLARTIGVAASKLSRGDTKRHSLSRIAGQPAQADKNASGRNSREPREWSGRYYGKRSEKDLRGTNRVQSGIVLIGRWECSIRQEVQCRREHYRSRLQRHIIIGKRGNVQHIAWIRQSARTKLSKTIVANVVDKTHIEIPVGCIPFRIIRQRFEGNKIPVAAEAAATAENISSASCIGNWRRRWSGVGARTHRRTRIGHTVFGLGNLP